MAELSSRRGLAIAPDGALYVADQGNNRVRKIAADGTIVTVVGGGNLDVASRPAATEAHLSAPDGLAFGPDGTLFIASDGQLVRVAPELPGLGIDDIVLPAESGHAVYVFSGRGKHLSTHDAFSGAALLTFEYDDAGLLASVTDLGGLKTTIERDSDGSPTEIVGPYKLPSVLTSYASAEMTS